MKNFASYTKRFDFDNPYLKLYSNSDHTSTDLTNALAGAYKTYYSRDPYEERTGLNRAFDMLSIANYAVMGGIKGLVDNGQKGAVTPWTGFRRGLRAGIPWGDGYSAGRTMGSDVLETMGWHPTNAFGRIAKGTLGFVGDVLLDPTTYISGGVSAAIKGTGKIGLKAFKAGAIEAVTKKYGIGAVEKVGDIPNLVRQTVFDKVSKEMPQLDDFAKNKMANDAYDDAFLHIAPSLGGMNNDLAEQIITHHNKVKGLPTDPEQLIKDADKLTKKYNKIAGLRENGRVDLKLANFPGGKKLFGSLADKKLFDFSDATIRKYSEKFRISSAYTSIRKSIYGTQFGRLFSNNAKLYQLSKHDPSALYDWIDMIDQTRGLKLDKIKATKHLEAESLKLGLDLDPSDMQTALALLQDKRAWKWITAKIGIASTHEGADARKGISLDLEDMHNEVDDLTKMRDNIEALKISHRDELDNLHAQRAQVNDEHFNDHIDLTHMKQERARFDVHSKEYDDLIQKYGDLHIQKNMDLAEIERIKKARKDLNAGKRKDLKRLDQLQKLKELDDAHVQGLREQDVLDRQANEEGIAHAQNVLDQFEREYQDKVKFIRYEYDKIKPKETWAEKTGLEERLKQLESFIIEGAHRTPYSKEELAGSMDWYSFNHGKWNELQDKIKALEEERKPLSIKEYDAKEGKNVRTHNAKNKPRRDELTKQIKALRMEQTQYSHIGKRHDFVEKLSSYLFNDSKRINPTIHDENFTKIIDMFNRGETDQKIREFIEARPDVYSGMQQTRNSFIANQLEYGEGFKYKNWNQYAESVKPIIDKLEGYNKELADMNFQVQDLSRQAYIDKANASPWGITLDEFNRLKNDPQHLKDELDKLVEMKNANDLMPPEKKMSQFQEERLGKKFNFLADLNDIIPKKEAVERQLTEANKLIERDKKVYEQIAHIEKRINFLDTNVEYGNNKVKEANQRLTDMKSVKVDDHPDIIKATKELDDLNNQGKTLGKKLLDDKLSNKEKNLRDIKHLNDKIANKEKEIEALKAYHDNLHWNNLHSVNNEYQDAVNALEATKESLRVEKSHNLPMHKKKLTLKEEEYKLFSDRATELNKLRQKYAVQMNEFEVRLKSIDDAVNVKIDGLKDKFKSTQHGKAKHAEMIDYTSAEGLRKSREFIASGQFKRTISDAKTRGRLAKLKITDGDIRRLAEFYRKREARTKLQKQLGYATNMTELNSMMKTILDAKSEAEVDAVIDQLYTPKLISSKKLTGDDAIRADFVNEDSSYDSNITRPNENKKKPKTYTKNKLDSEYDPEDIVVTKVDKKIIFDDMVTAKIDIPPFEGSEAATALHQRTYLYSLINQMEPMLKNIFKAPYLELSKRKKEFLYDLAKYSLDSIKKGGKSITSVGTDDFKRISGLIKLRKLHDKIKDIEKVIQVNSHISWTRKEVLEKGVPAEKAVYKVELKQKRIVSIKSVKSTGERTRQEYNLAGELVDGEAKNIVINEPSIIDGFDMNRTDSFDISDAPPSQRTIPLTDSYQFNKERKTYVVEDEHGQQMIVRDPSEFVAMDNNFVPGMVVYHNEKTLVKPAVKGIAEKSKTTWLNGSVKEITKRDGGTVYIVENHKGERFEVRPVEVRKKANYFGGKQQDINQVMKSRDVTNMDILHEVADEENYIRDRLKAIKKEYAFRHMRRDGELKDAMIPVVDDYIERRQNILQSINDMTDTVNVINARVYGEFDESELQMLQNKTYHFDDTRLKELRSKKYNFDDTRMKHLENQTYDYTPAEIHKLENKTYNFPDEKRINDLENMTYHSVDLNRIDHLETKIKDMQKLMDDDAVLEDYLRTLHGDDWIKLAENKISIDFLAANPQYNEKVLDVVKFMKKQFQDWGEKEVITKDLKKGQLEANADSYVAHIVTANGDEFFKNYMFDVVINDDGEHALRAIPRGEKDKKPFLTQDLGYGEEFSQHSMTRTFKIPEKIDKAGLNKGELAWEESQYYKFLQKQKGFDDQTIIDIKNGIGDHTHLRFDEDNITRINYDPTIEQINAYLKSNKQINELLKGQNLFSENLAEIYLQRGLTHLNVWYDHKYMTTMMKTFGRTVEKFGDLDKGYKLVANVGHVKQLLGDYATEDMKALLKLQASEEMSAAYTAIAKRAGAMAWDEIKMSGKDEIKFKHKEIKARANQMARDHLSIISKEWYRDMRANGVKGKLELPKMAKKDWVNLVNSQIDQIIAKEGKPTYTKATQAEKDLLYQKHFTNIIDDEGRPILRRKTKEELSKMWHDAHERIKKEVGFTDRDLGEIATPMLEINEQQFKGLKNLHPDSVAAVNDAIVQRANQSRKIQLYRDTHRMLKLYDKFTHWFKIQQTAVMPSFHLRNKMSNIFLHWLAVGSDAFNIDMHSQAIKTFRSNGVKGTKMVKLGDGTEMSWNDLLEEADVHDVIDRGMFAVDVGAQNASEGILRFLPGKYDITDTKNFIYTKKMTAFGNMIENSDRLLQYVAHRKLGKTASQSADLVNEFLFDYSDITHFEATVMKRIIPFYVWMRKNSKLQLMSMLEQPGKYQFMAKMSHGLEGMNNNDEDINSNFVNDFAKDWLQLPFHIINKEGRAEPLLLNPALPYMDLSKIPNPFKSWNSLYDAISMSNPLLKIPIENIINKQVYFQQAIREDNTTTGQKISATIDHAFSHASLYNFGKDLFNKAGVDWGLELVANLTGVKVLSYDYDKYKFQIMQEVLDRKPGLDELAWGKITEGFDGAMSSVRGLMGDMITNLNDGRPKPLWRYEGTLAPISKFKYDRLPDNEKAKYIPPTKKDQMAYTAEAERLKQVELAKTGKLKRFTWVLLDKLNMGGAKHPDFALGRVTHVSDGDTFSIDTGDGKSKTVRMLLVDTPETVDPRLPKADSTRHEQMPFGKVASNHTKSALIYRDVKLVFDHNADKMDKYGRFLAYVEVDGKDYGESLIREGLAKYSYNFNNYSRGDEFKAAEKLAYDEKKGIWQLKDYADVGTGGDYYTNYALQKNYEELMNSQGK